MDNQNENSKILIKYGKENLKAIISQILIENLKDLLGGKVSAKKKL